MTPECCAPEGGSAPTSSIPKKWRAHFARLMTLQDRLLAESGLKSAESRGVAACLRRLAYGRAEDGFDAEFAVCLLSAKSDPLAEIRDALRRIKKGAYGVCETTGEPIEDRRLAAIPWTRFSADVEARREIEGVVARSWRRALV